ncbi:hypothetical protein [Paenibacillus soyae]|uniref:Secreted protein n=1 Tax=Paenibacillus soyae TaxID=2969249 RepID=A0A9X2S7Q0_9BACL|nr:hypothetical protein [Paenibacillus soyae]MCR2803301.1 hypothetical protein [Paenibacillus soyae]
MQRNWKWIAQGRFYRAAVLAFALTAALTACGGNGDNGGGGHEGHGEGSVVASAPETAQASNPTGGHAGHDSGSAHSQHGETAESGIAMEWSFAPQSPKAGDTVTITMTARDENGEKVQEYELGHEKEMHLIVVREDLSEFYHVHPIKRADGEFTQEMTLPSGGTYKLFADFIPAGHEQMTASGTLELAGNENVSPPQPDGKLLRSEQGVEVELALSSTKAGEESELAFTLRDAASKAGLTDLEPYLGAIGHVVIISEDTEHYLHVHPMNEDDSGPVARFATAFPEEGLYRIWGQFQRNGETFIVPFTIQVNN